MKVTVLQKDFSKVVSTASHFISTRAQVPVLGSLVLKAEKTQLLISATNLEIAFSTAIGAKVEEEGEIAIPAKVLSEIVSNLASESLTLSSDKEHLEIQSEHFKGKILGMNTSDFPFIQNSLPDEHIKLPSSFLSALPSLLFSVSKDEARPVLTGILASCSDDFLTLVATDGFRLSLRKIPVQGVTSFENIIIPKNIVQTLLRIVSEDTSLSCSIDEANNQILFGFGNTLITSRLIQGTYPPYEKIIPQSSRTIVSVDKEEFLKAIKLGSVFARDVSNRISLLIGTTELSVKAQSGKSGDQTSTVSAKVEGEGLEIIFNYKFIEEFLQSVSGNDISIALNEPMNAGVFKDIADPFFLYLIMPLKV